MVGGSDREASARDGFKLRAHGSLVSGLALDKDPGDAVRQPGEELQGGEGHDRDLGK